MAMFPFKHIKSGCFDADGSLDTVYETIPYDKTSFPGRNCSWWVWL